MKFTEKQKQTIRKIYTTLKKAGFDDISIAGMLGNALSESSFDPDSISKSNYHGLWQNSSDIHNAVVGTYGNHNIDTQLRYVIDWTNAHKNVTKGKYRDWLATGAGKFKKSGYKDAHEASDAFMKLYERPVITDKNGNIIGYQKDVERRANSAIMYDYINSQFNNKPVVKMIDMGDGRKRMQVSYPHLQKSVQPTDWSSSEKRLPSVEKYIPEPITTDYTPLREVAEQYDALNGAGSPSYGGYTPRLQDVQEVNSRINHDILNLIGINPTINKFQIPFAQKYNKGKNTTVRTLPRFDDGTPTTSTWNHYPDKKLLGYTGSHSNASMVLDEMGGDLSKLRETNSGPVYLLDRASQYVPTKHQYMFDPSIIDALGNMHINLKDPSIYKSLLPLIPTGAALYMGAKDFKQEDWGNSINNLQALAEGVGYNKGKDIHIKPSKRGTFTAAAKKHNKSVQAFANQVLSNPGKYSKAMRKKAQFAKNASKWKH